MHIRIGDVFVKSCGAGLAVGEYRTVVAREGGIQPKPESIGQEREYVFGYYGRLKEALTAMAGLEVYRASGAQTVEELQAMLGLVLEAVEALPADIGRQLQELERQVKGQECASEE